MTYPTNMTKDLCLVCGAEAKQYFTLKTEMPLCGGVKCEEVLIEEINALLNETTAVSDEGE
jgi:hypothetical protein